MDVGEIVTAIVIAAAGFVVASVVDRVLRRRRDLPPESLTRYHVLRRTIYVAIVLAGIAIAALAVPPVQGVASAILTSAAVISVIVGVAARASLGNFVSGLVLAFSQPIRIGDQIEFRGIGGTVEDVGRIYTRVRTPDGAWLQVPNDLLASDTITNWTIVNPECTAQVRLLLPLSADLGPVMGILLHEARAVSIVPGRAADVRMTDLAGDPGGTRAEVSVQVWAPDHATAERVSADLRARIQERLRTAGLFAEAP